MAKVQDGSSIQMKGIAIKRLRLANGLTQEELATRLDVSPKTISRAENSHRLSMRKARALATELRVSLSDIIQRAAEEKRRRRGDTRLQISLFTTGRFSPRTGRVSSFCTHLDQFLNGTGYSAHYVPVAAPELTSGRLLPTTADWESTLSAHRSKFEASNYFVTFGTPASTAFRLFMGSQFGKTPTVFLAVTDPVASQLVTRTRLLALPPDAISDLVAGGFVNAGNRSGSGMSVAGAALPRAGMVSSILDSMFPERELVYVYCASFDSDELFARSLRESHLVEANRIAIKKLTSLPTARELARKDHVYFSWYTFAYMYHSPKFPEILRERAVISTSPADAESPRMASAAVGADDAEIGRLGALLVAQHVKGEIRDFGSTDVLVTTCKHWPNVSTAAQFGISFPEHALRTAAEVFH